MGVAGYLEPMRWARVLLCAPRVDGLGGGGTVWSSRVRDGLPPCTESSVRIVVVVCAVVALCGTSCSDTGVNCAV